MTNCLLDLSHELLHGILAEVEATDLAALSLTCRALNSFIKGNRLLCKDVYLRAWDYPSGPEPCWETSLHHVAALRKLLESDDIDTKRRGFVWAAPAIAPLLTADSSEHNAQFLRRLFKSQQNIDVFLAGSGLFTYAGTSSQLPAATPEDRQIAARLHCLYGVPIDCAPSQFYVAEEDDSTPTPSYAVLQPSSTCDQDIQIPTNNYARAIVYDLRRYTDDSLWGPFKDDGSQHVDWEKLEAIMVVLGFNMRLFNRKAPHVFSPVWNKPWEGASPNSYISEPHPDPFQQLGPPGDLDSQDPYGITGMWMRVVCFLDYHDLFAFNFLHSVPADQPRDPIDTREAIRIIRLKLQVSKIEPPGPDDGQDLPVVSFTGTSWSLHASWDANASSQIRGEVRQTQEGAIRWTTYSIFHGEERWRSEGVQVGGIRSGRGVLGNWFDKDYDRHGPAGPTAFWKVSDHITDKEDELPEQDFDDEENSSFESESDSE